MKNGNEEMSNWSFAEIEKWKKRAHEAEGELSIIKGIGNNSPETKALKAENEELKKELALVREDAQVEYLRRDLRIKDLEQINREHQDMNGKLHIEITRLKGGI